MIGSAAWVPEVTRLTSEDLYDVTSRFLDLSYMNTTPPYVYFCLPLWAASSMPYLLARCRSIFCIPLSSRLSRPWSSDKSEESSGGHRKECGICATS